MYANEEHEVRKWSAMPLEPSEKGTIKLRNAGLREHKGQLVAHGWLDLESMGLLRVDEYQREELRKRYGKKALHTAVLEGAEFPVIVLGMRGDKVSFPKGSSDCLLLNDTYIIDGLQRVLACKRAAEIARGVQVVQADQDKQTAVIRAEGEKQRAITLAEGTLQQAKLTAEGVRVQGEAKGAAEQAVLMAPVNSQIALAKEIGSNDKYQEYLITIRRVEASQTVGIEQAKALTAAQIKVIANAGTPMKGVETAMELFTPAGGLQLGAALEALKNTEVGAKIVSALTNGSGHEEGSHQE